MQFEEEGKARENEVFYVKSVRVRMNTESKKKTPLSDTVTVRKDDSLLRRR